MKTLLGVAFTFGGSILLFTATPAYAYLDPSSGSMLLQVLLGGVAGLIVLMKLYWHRTLTFLGIRKPEPEQEQTPDTIPPPQGHTNPVPRKEN